MLTLQCLVLACIFCIHLLSSSHAPVFIPGLGHPHPLLFLWTVLLSPNISRWMLVTAASWVAMVAVGTVASRVAMVDVGTLTSFVAMVAMGTVTSRVAMLVVGHCRQLGSHDGCGHYGQLSN